MMLLEGAINKYAKPVILKTGYQWPIARAPLNCPLRANNDIRSH